MTDSTRVFFNDDSPIQVEIILATPQSGLQETSRGGAADKVKQIGDDVLFHAFHTIYKIARKTEKLITDLPSAAPDADHPLTGSEIEFGIKFDSGSNAAGAVAERGRNRDGETSHGGQMSAQSDRTTHPIPLLISNHQGQIKRRDILHGFIHDYRPVA